jgi:hypothetical protein
VVLLAPRRCLPWLAVTALYESHRLAEHFPNLFLFCGRLIETAAPTFGC